MPTEIQILLTVLGTLGGVIGLVIVVVGIIATFNAARRNSIMQVAVERSEMLERENSNIRGKATYLENKIDRLLSDQQMQINNLSAEIVQLKEIVNRPVPVQVTQNAPSSNHIKQDHLDNIMNDVRAEFGADVEPPTVPLTPSAGTNPWHVDPSAALSEIESSDAV